MRKINTLLLLTILLYFTGCEEKKSNNILTNNVIVQSEEISNIQITKKIEPKLKDNFKFIFSDTNEEQYTINIKDKKITINESNEKIILLNFFSTQSSASIGQIPYLIDIQKEYNSKLLIVGILLNTKPDKYNLKKLQETENFNYNIYHSVKSNKFTKSFTSHFGLNEIFSPPISILFKNGKLYRYYEGAVPVEMLKHDINNIINKDK